MKQYVGRDIFYNPQDKLIVVSRGWKLRPYYATPARIKRLMNNFITRTYKHGYYFYSKQTGEGWL
jgi:hypothetical protein